MKKILITLFLIPSILWAATFTAPTSFLEAEEPEWKHLAKEILSTPDKEIYIYWAGGGGYVDMMDDFVKAVVQSRQNGKRITLILTGRAVSAHAMVACYVDDVRAESTAVLIFHTIFYRMPLTGEKVYIDRETKFRMYTCLRNNILSISDINAIVNKHQRLEIYPDGRRILLPDWP